METFWIGMAQTQRECVEWEKMRRKSNMPRGANAVDNDNGEMATRVASLTRERTVAVFQVPLWTSWPLIRRAAMPRDKFRHGSSSAG